MNEHMCFCHSDPERSEGEESRRDEILRCAQDDSNLDSYDE